MKSTAFFVVVIFKDSQKSSLILYFFRKKFKTKMKLKRKTIWNSTDLDENYFKNRLLNTTLNDQINKGEKIKLGLEKELNQN